MDESINANYDLNIKSFHRLWKAGLGEMPLYFTTIILRTIMYREERYFEPVSPQHMLIILCWLTKLLRLDITSW